MSDVNQKSTINTNEAEQLPQTVPLEEYSKLYNQALELESRYKKLLELYNNLMEMYLSKK